ncbi:FmdB family zinc ribbon protein [Chloroflexota bacterium]
MPVYEYECPSCSFRFEILRGFSENGSVSCPECGCDAQRIFTSVPVIFKGSGFYVTDHRGNHDQPKSTISEPESESVKPEPAGNGKDKTGTTSTSDTD